MITALPPDVQIVHTHDQFFRTAMSDLRVVREFLQIHLPAEIFKVIDLDNLVLQPRSFTSDIRKESVVDVLYKTAIKDKEAYLYLLFEHQSKPDKLMAFRLLKYICNIIDRHLKMTKEDTIPLVYPIVVYHGKQPYSYSTDINDLVDAPRELVDQYFLKPFHLIDLGKISDQELKKRAWSGVMEFALKHIFARDILPYLRNIAELMRRLDQSGGRDYISIVLEYLLTQGDMQSEEAFFDIVNTQISVDVGEKIMSLGDRLIARGMEKGMEKGMEQRNQVIAKRLLSEGIDLASIARITELSLDKIKELENTPV